MSSENRTGTQPGPDAARRQSGNGKRPEEPVPAGRKALERALSEAGKSLEDLTRQIG
jgi:hypothetical protein